MRRSFSILQTRLHSACTRCRCRCRCLHRKLCWWKLSTRWVQQVGGAAIPVRLRWAALPSSRCSWAAITPVCGSRWASTSALAFLRDPGRHHLGRCVAQSFFAAAVCVSQRPTGHRIVRVHGRSDHRQQPVRIARGGVQCGRHDDVRGLVHRGPGVAGQVEHATGALHEGAVRHGDVVLRLVFRRAGLALGTLATVLAMRTTGAAGVITPSGFKVQLAPALLQALAGLTDGRQRRATARRTSASCCSSGSFAAAISAGLAGSSNASIRRFNGASA